MEKIKININDIFNNLFYVLPTYEKLLDFLVTY